MPSQSVAKREDAEVREARNAVDTLLIANARKSPEEIEQKTGIPAREAMERLAVILRTRDWMTDRMEERLLLIEMSNLIDHVKDRMEDASDAHYADVANVALRGYEAISKRLSERRKLTEEDMNEISRAQAEAFMDVFRLSITDVVEYMSEIHSDSDIDFEADLNAGFQRAIPKAWEAVKGNIRE